VTALLRAEWTKLRSVTGWVVGLVIGAAFIVGLGLFPGMQGSCGRHGPGSECVPTVGPDGGEVADGFTFVRRPLAGDGSITVRVASMTGQLPTDSGLRPGLAPWAKAGVIVKASAEPGAAYAAVMLTGDHGVRMQYDFTHDVAGAADARWLRLTRTGDTVTGAASADGARWTTIGTARLPGLPGTVQAGLFTTSPQYTEAVSSGLLQGASGGPSRATATFDHLAVEGAWPDAAWTSAPPFADGDVERAGDTFTVSGSGDIAPMISGAGGLGVSITQSLAGTFAGLIAAVVIGAMFITAEYRRGLIRTTIAAGPRRGRVLAAKAAVVGAATFGAGLLAAAVVVAAGPRILRANGVYVHPATTLTEVRVVVGTAALLAVAAVLALGIGAVVRRGAPAIAAVVVLIVLPYLLAVSVLPVGAARWLLRVTPAAAFAVQQTVLQYPQVSSTYTPAEGYFPLAPWAGFAVLCGWAAVALTAAAVLLRRRDV